MNRLPVLLSRAARANAEFAAALSARVPGVEVLHSPLMEIVPVDPEAWPGPDAALAFSSRNAVAALGARQAGDGRLAYCVGARTAQAAREAGFAPLAGDGDLAGLIALILENPPGRPLWYLHGVHRSGDLAGSLQALGQPCRGAVVYDQRALSLRPEVERRLEGGEAMVAPLFSARSARLLADATKNIGANLRVVALSKAVAKEWPGVAETVERPEVAEMLEAVAHRAG